MQPATLLLVGVPPLLADIIVARTVRGGEVARAASVDRVAAVQALRRKEAGLVISGDADEALIIELLHSRASVRVVTITGDGREGTLHRLIPHHVRLGERWLEWLAALARGEDDETMKGASPCQ